jgi:glutaconate CoA-transferase subunit B
MSAAPAELIAVVLSRSLRDGDVMITGTNAAITRAAMAVAQACGKPRAATAIGAFGTVDPSAALAPRSGGDQDFLPGRVVSGLGRIVCDQLRGLADVICLGGLQVDRLGRVNLAVVGPYARPTLRGPGTVGISLIASIPRTFLYFEDHDPRTFVECVDFLGAEGIKADGGGVEVIVTPLAVLAPVEDRSRIDLVSVHPGVGFERVQARTGFALDEARARPTPAPSEAELAALRADPDGATLRDLVLPR